MQPLLLLKQTLETPYDQGPLRLDGENAHFSGAEQLFWKGPSRQRRGREFSVAIEAPEQTLALVFRLLRRGLVLERMVATDDSPGAQSSVTLVEHETRPVENLPEALRRQWAGQRVIVRVVRQQCLLGLRVITPAGHLIAAHVPWPWPLDLKRLAAELIHVPGLRGNPRRYYPVTQASDVFPGVFSHYTASVIATWGDTRDSRSRHLGAWLRALGLTSQAESRRLDDTRVELRVGRLATVRRGGAEDLVNVADVGFGVSQVLPVLVALLVAKPGQIVYLEQPEIHLHPRAQVALATCLLEAARRGVVVVAETHSNLLLRGIQEQVASGSFEPALVALHWFTRDQAGATHVTSADLDSNGAFGEWPEDLSETELEIEDRYLRHVGPRD